MNSNHTPGPWIVDDAQIHPSDGREVYRGPSGYGHDVILTIDTDNREGGLITEVDRANLSLAAAAPELLEALESLFEHCAMIHKTWGDGCNQKEADAAMKAGRAAIAKARGEA